ncbi:lantibiotic dehydratase [Streptomyces sp. NPDC053367]|uniref:lantibiotic dehydratase n=1 Tax=Streptomyces sp. NPDC053367 TaxID=3365700 RepID=UPI0037D76576
MPRPIYRRSGDVLVLRAAAMPATARPADWPAVDSSEACLEWLARVWEDSVFVASLRAASPRLVGYVERILDGADIESKRVHKAACSVAGYLLRATGRPTPFGLFAGVALAAVGPASAEFGTAHHAVARPDTLWVDHVRRDLEGRADVLPYLTMQMNTTAFLCGDTINVPRPGGRIATARISRPLSALLQAVQKATTGQELERLLIEVGGTPAQARHLIEQALADGYLISNLSAPMTNVDPAGHILRILAPHEEELETATRRVLAQLAEAGQLLAAHNEASGTDTDALREAADGTMRFVPASSRSRICIDLRLDAQVSVPAEVLDEAEYAADVLLRLTRARGESTAWATYATHFWERYGAGVLVPVRDAADLAAGIGFPADYPLSLWQDTSPTVLSRDEWLAAKASQAAVTGNREVALTDTDIDQLTDGAEIELVAPHVELGIRIRSVSRIALDRGDFLIELRPAWTAGALSGRFMVLLGTAMSDLYRTLPTTVEGALPAQLSFSPVFPHGENVARIPAVVPHVLSVGEHQEPSDHVIDLDDLAVFSTGRRLHLVSVSRRRVVEPLVLHPLALEKQAPPIARFLAMLGRGSVTAWTAFDWGPAAAALPFLPRIRYRRAILAPARWKLSVTALPAGPFSKQWHAALLDWASMWRCPTRLELHDDDRTMSLDLTESLHARLIHQHLQRRQWAVLCETAPSDDLGWIGHAHEITVPLAAAGSQLPHPDLTSAPLLTNEDLPGVGVGRWLQAKVFTHPTAMDQIITDRLPGLLQELGTSEVWLVRYRSLHESDHLRIRVPVGTNTLASLAAWTDQLTADRLASHLVIDGYRPETGRYGVGPAMEAAEAVFIADTLVTRYALSDLPRFDREVVCALSMIDLAEGFLGTREGWKWMAAAAEPGAGRIETTRLTLKQVHGLPLLTASARLAASLTQRRDALRRYRICLGDQRLGQVLESLLHMHHNRMVGPDRASEAACRHAARQACRSLTIREGA